MLAREMDMLQVKGKLKPVKCFHLIAPNDSPKAQDIKIVSELFTSGVHLYREQKWNEAIERFKEALSIWDDDGPTHMYIKRCNDFKKTPPGSDWNGVYIMRTK